MSQVTGDKVKVDEVKVTEEKEVKKPDPAEVKTTGAEKIVETDDEDEESESLEANLPESPKNAEKSDQEVSWEILWCDFWFF